MANVEGHLKIVELNALSTSGLYALDTDKIVKTLVEYYEPNSKVWKYWNWKGCP